MAGQTGLADAQRSVPPRPGDPPHRGQFSLQFMLADIRRTPCKNSPLLEQKSSDKTGPGRRRLGAVVGGGNAAPAPRPPKTKEQLLKAAGAARIAGMGARRWAQGRWRRQRNARVPPPAQGRRLPSSAGVCSPLRLFAALHDQQQRYIARSSRNSSAAALISRLGGQSFLAARRYTPPQTATPRRPLKVPTASIDAFSPAAVLLPQMEILDDSNASRRPRFQQPRPATSNRETSPAAAARSYQKQDSSQKHPQGAPYFCPPAAAVARYRTPLTTTRGYSQPHTPVRRATRTMLLPESTPCFEWPPPSPLPPPAGSGLLLPVVTAFCRMRQPPAHASPHEPSATATLRQRPSPPGTVCPSSAFRAQHPVASSTARPKEAQRKEISAAA